MSVDTAMKYKCMSCSALKRELLKLQELSEKRAKQDHDQCVTMFQQMQELVRLNEAFNRGCSRPSQCGLDESASTSSNNASEESVVVEGASDSEQTHTRRLQMIIVQQAKDLETLRRRQRDATIDGVASMFNYQGEGDEDQRGDSGEDASDEYEEQSDCRATVKQYANKLRKLPLTSLHAQLKGKDLQLQRLQRIIAKLETRFGQLVDRKRSMAKSFQQTARTQQAHLKKYLAYIRQQKDEKKELEHQLRELKQYVDVLEKKVISSTRI